RPGSPTPVHRFWIVLALLPIIIALLRQDLAETLMAIALSGLIAWIYLQIADDLDLSPQGAAMDSQRAFQFVGNHRALVSLAQPLQSEKVGAKAANLSQLKRWGYAVPDGWVIPPGDDAEPLVQALKPTPEQPFVVRSSAIGEDSELASAAGQYQSLLQVSSRVALQRAIAECQDCYDHPAAVQYRRDRNLPEDGMAVIVQVQIQGQFSGVAFSRDPGSGDSEVVAIEGLPGPASRVVSGQFTPERYLVKLPTTESEAPTIVGNAGKLPSELVQQVAQLVRELEVRYHGMPQDMEWTYDGQTLWVLQTRPITTLLPIWTRRIAAEVIPGAIRPLTWSINLPLTCGVWAELFQTVLGDRTAPFAVEDLATLHYGHAYFNATLLSQLFRRMGLPPESLEFLTRGASLGRPSTAALLKSLPGLLRLLGQELTLHRQFAQDRRAIFAPLLERAAPVIPPALPPQQALAHIDALLAALKRATYFSILGPLSAAIRQRLLRVDDSALDNTVLPETAALRSLHTLAEQYSEVWPQLDGSAVADPAMPTEAHQPALRDFAALLSQYGYLSEVGTDIAIPTWREDPESILHLLQQFSAQSATLKPTQPAQKLSWSTHLVQRRVALKGHIAEVYSRLLAELRYTLLALEHHALATELAQQPGDLFFLTLSEIRSWVTQSNPQQLQQLSDRIAERRHEFDLAQHLPSVPTVVYGTPPPLSVLEAPAPITSGAYCGIGASPGIAEGVALVLRSLRQVPNNLSRQTILVVPYTDAGWSPLLAQVGGIVAEVGGRLSHGAIIAREYGIPAVMDISQATHHIKNGQHLRVDGYRGTVEILTH
ncbi:MAG TPA: PEP/pyruvate-binding domain-containing protein, partial [Stenomitos sp.]